MTFVKGKSGNPLGRPKEDPAVRALCEKYTPEAIETLAEIMRNKQEQAGARVTAAAHILRKTLPDLASHEHKGIDGVFVIPPPNQTAEEWEAENAPKNLQ